MIRDPQRNERPATDELLTEIADYVHDFTGASADALGTARLVLLDSIACALLALEDGFCRRLLGPVLPGTTVHDGTRVPGTSHEVDPIKGAFDIGACIGWLGFNDTWLAAEWGHPSDNLGAILAIADHVSRTRVRAGNEPLTVRDVLHATVQAHEIQGILALTHAFNDYGLDHVLLVRVASAAVTTHLAGGTRDQVRDALSQAFLDGGPLGVYRHAPNTGPRAIWAAADAASRAVRLALMTLAGEPGYAAPITTQCWGLQDAAFGRRTIQLAQPLECHVVENILFRPVSPGEFHAQTAIEAAVMLHPRIRARIEDIDTIIIHTQLSAIRIIDKRGPLHNRADRNHCLQYMTVVALLYGELKSEHFEDRIAADPRIDRLRDKTVVFEDPTYTREYLDPSKRSIPNAVQIFFNDGTSTLNYEVHYPVGHRRRRREALPLLRSKVEGSVRLHYQPGHADRILTTIEASERLDVLPVHDLMSLLSSPPKPSDPQRASRSVPFAEPNDENIRS